MSDEPAECPLCMEALEIDDHSFFPCTCGYQICRFCWHRIRTDENGLCPACRKQYPEDPAEFKPLTEDELQNIKKERKQKDVQRKQKAAENRKHLANVRVVQRNLVFVVGLSPRLADPEVLKKHEYFGKFGKIHKVVINQSTSYAGSQGPSASAYVTYVKPEDALRAILTVNNVHVEGRTLKTSLGTTKYCSHFLKGTHCQKNDCMYLHELGEEAASFTKDEMQAGKHQDYEQMLIEQFLNAQNTANNHVLAHSKLKKSASPQSIDNPDVIPSLMDMTGDIKHSLHSSGPLLPNPGQGTGANGQAGHTSQTSGWPLLDSNGAGGKTDASSSIASKAQGPNSRNQARANSSTANGVGNVSSSKAVGAGRQRGSNSVNSTDENHINSGSPVSSTSASPSATEEDLSSSPGQSNGHSHSSVVQAVAQPVPVSTRESSNGTVSAPSTSSSSPPCTNSALPLQPPAAEETANVIGAIGSNRRPLLSDPSGAQGLSFFGNNLLNPNTARSAQPPSPIASQDTMPNVSLPNQEMSETLPVSSSTDWSAAFGFNSKELLPEDDLGFDPCAESFKGLADLIEKENSGLQQQHHLMHTPGQSGLPQTRLGSPSQSNGFPSHPLPHSPHQNNTQPSLRNLPPGFSISHIQQQQQQLQQQQQQQHFFRPELSGSKVLELLPQFPPVTSQQRFNPLHSYNSMPLDLNTPTQQPQRDLYNMKDMQEQLRSMLPNINISFGSMPHQQQPQPPQQQVPNSMPHTHHSQHLNKSWPLSSSPDSSWNDPAILTTSQFSDSAESAPHWLKSLQQLTESDAPPTSHRLPFVQQFPLATGGAGGWPPHTHNPPPGFRAPGLAGQQATESHQMAEVLQ